MLKETIKAYLYQEYHDDDNLQAFFTAYNAMSQSIYEWMTSAHLPIFIGSYNYAEQLRWIAKGIYGQDAPIIVTSKSVTSGPYNMLMFNQLAINGRRTKKTSNQITASDDVFKRIMTWNFYKGDGFHFTIPWLKRRIMRFLNGVDGSDIANDQQFPISVTFGDDGVLKIGVIRSLRTIDDSSQYNTIEYNQQGYGQLDTLLEFSANLSFAEIFKAAFDNGLLHMPFWAKTNIEIIG